MGNRGGSVENAVRDFLSQHLARNFAVGTGEAIDAQGARSGQLDVVISNIDQPLISPVNDAGLFLIEGVASAGEVKSKLTTQELRSAISAAVKFKRLRNVHNPGDLISSNPVDIARYHECPPFFLLAMESEVAIPTLLRELHNASASKGREVSVGSTGNPPITVPPIDAAFVLGQGAAFLFTEGSSFGLNKANGERVLGWTFSHRETGVLTEFLMWLHAAMPRVIRFAPVSTPYLTRPGKFSSLEGWYPGGLQPMEAPDAEDDPPEAAATES